MAQRKRTTNEPNFEASLQKLEAIVKRLEEEEIPLEASLKLFAEGQTLARACEEQLRAAENQIRQLLEKPSGKIEEAPFEEQVGAEAASADEDDEDEGADEDEEGEDDDLPATQSDSSAAGSAPASFKAPQPPAQPQGPDELPF